MSKLRDLWAKFLEFIGLGRYRVVAYDPGADRVILFDLFQKEEDAAQEIERMIRKGAFSIYEDVIIHNELNGDLIYVSRGARRIPMLGV